jgi:hypothetical protein
VVLFVSDHDPSLLDLQRAWEDALAGFRAPIEAFVRIGLNARSGARLAERAAAAGHGF